MSTPASFEETIVSYPLTKQLSLSLVELHNVQPDFSRCPYCASNAYWHLVWPASLALSRYVAKDFSEEYWQGKQVLVIGCGAGLESVTLAKLGAQVTALDHIPAALQLVQRNCQQNALPPVHTLWQCWWDTNSLQQLGQYDALIGSDVLYEAADGICLRTIVTTALKLGGTGLFADPLRASAQAFLAQLESSGLQIQMHQSHTQWGAEPEEVRIYRVDHQSE